MKMNLLLFSLFFGFFQVAEADNQVCRDVSLKLKNGDLVFIALENPIFHKVAEGTNSWTSHIGVAFREPRGNWNVWESTFPFAKKTPICDYVEKAGFGLLEIKRTIQPLTSEEIKLLKLSINEKMGSPYDHGFNLDRPYTYFCSKLVYSAFLNINREIGKVETLRSLAEANPSFDLTFFKFWYFTGIPWDRRTVTPASQLRDEDLKTIYQSPNLQKLIN